MTEFEPAMNNIIQRAMSAQKQKEIMADKCQVSKVGDKEDKLELKPQKCDSHGNVISDTESEKKDTTYKNGVRTYNGKYLSKLPYAIGMNRNVLWFPNCVLHQTHKPKCIFTSWETYSPSKKKKIEHTYKMWMEEGMAYPNPGNAKYLDAILAMYALNLPEHPGEPCRFKVSDVAKYLNIKDSGPFYDKFYETCEKYNHAFVRWHESYGEKRDNKHYRVTVKTNSPILVSYIDREDCKKKCDGWNEILIHPKLENTIRRRDTRLFPTHVLGNAEIDKHEYLVYRYFFAFDDRKAVKRLAIDVCNALNYGNKDKRRFKQWIERILSSLKKRGLIEYYKLPTAKRWKEYSIQTIEVKSIPAARSI